MKKSALAFMRLTLEELISSYGNDDIQQKYISRQANDETYFQRPFQKG